jgi:hypothetical protein
MSGKRLPLLLFIASMAIASPSRAEISAIAAAEIDGLLQQVQISDCVFIRNDSEHDAEDAADHLRLKLKRGKKYVGNSEQFIDRLASKSSWTGKPYTVRCPGQEERAANEWLYELLDTVRNASPSPEPQ